MKKNSYEVRRLTGLVEGAENTALAPVWKKMPAEKAAPVTVEGAVVNVSDLMPEDRSDYR